MQCGGNFVCQHNKRKSECKECKGSQICEHNRIRIKCKECNGSQICEHDRLRRYCKECHGSGICEHNRRKHICKECHGTSICEHNRLRSICKECHGSQICEHNRIKQSCVDCNGSSICKSRLEPYYTGCRTTGNRKLNGFCSHCFVNIFPEDPRVASVHKKSKEIQVVSHVLSKYEGFKHEKPFYVDLEGGCCATKRRIDLRKLINNTMLCIEVDEEQHKRYIKENEQKRYDDLFMDFSGKYIFIRYNPDKFVDKYKVSKNPYLQTRMEVLENVINKHIERIEKQENTDLVEVHHVFYDEI